MKNFNLSGTLMVERSTTHQNIPQPSAICTSRHMYLCSLRNVRKRMSRFSPGSKLFAD